MLRGMLAFLAINSTYRGPSTPGTATCLAFGFAVPDENAAMMTKLEAASARSSSTYTRLFVLQRRRAPVPRQGRRDPRRRRPRHRRPSARRSAITAPVVISNLSPDLTLIDLVGADTCPPTWSTRLSGRDHRASFVQMHFALDGLPEFAPPYELLNEPGMQASIGIFNSPKNSNASGRTAGAASSRTIRRSQCRSRPCTTPAWRPPASTRPARSRMRSPSRTAATRTANSRTRWRRRSIDKITRLRTELPRHPDPAHHVRAVPHAHDVRRARR